MIANYPEHVIRATADLQRAGRLIDERKTRPPEPAESSADRRLDTVPKMNLHTTPVRIVRPAAPPVPPVAPAAPVAREDLEQVWKNNGLTRRHLDISTGANTDPTARCFWEWGLGKISTSGITFMMTCLLRWTGHQTRFRRGHIWNVQKRLYAWSSRTWTTARVPCNSPTTPGRILPLTNSTTA